jgi:hypothetical protein
MSTRTFPSLVLAGPLLAVACTWLAADRTVVVVGALVLVLAGACVWRPDGHWGIAVIATIAIEWMATVDDNASPWALGVAAGLALFHSSLAAMTIAPPGARWTQAMCRRWLRRGATLGAATAATWVMVALVGDRRPPAATALVTAALVTLALGAVWGRRLPSRTGSG